MQVTIYHNPKCSKSRAALELLKARGIKPVVVDYLRTPPGLPELRRLLELLKLSPRELLRSREPEYKIAGLDDPECSDTRILAAMAKYPKLIERPIVVAGKKAALGRPPENILRILK